MGIVGNGKQAIEDAIRVQNHLLSPVDSVDKLLNATNDGSLFYVYDNAGLIVAFITPEKPILMHELKETFQTLLELVRTFFWSARLRGNVNVSQWRMCISVST